MTLSRRGFIFLLSALPFAPKAGLAQSVSTSGDQNHLFNGTERRLLGSLCEQIFPKDEFPGAIELGVPGFIERCLREGRPWTGIYRAGSAQQTSSRSVYQRISRTVVRRTKRRLLEKCRRGFAESGLAFSASKDFFRISWIQEPHPARLLQPMNMAATAPKQPGT
jgi:hypothetical protein